ncbi:17296_t:CDS:2, partial [Dentiscutata erythropus]
DTTTNVNHTISEIANWTNEDFMELERILHNCIPLIRFFQISSSEFYDKVWPFNKILPENFKEDIIRYHFKRNAVITSSNGLSAQSLIPKYALPPRIIPFDSALIKAEHVAKLCDWIDRKDGNLNDAKLSRVSRPGYAIRIKDKTHGPCFGDKDLWMKNNFNAYDSCSSDKDDYTDRVTTLSKFWVLEYEVFQVIRK